MASIHGTGSVLALVRALCFVSLWHLARASDANAAALRVLR